MEDTSLRFVPSRVQGLPDVSEVCLFHDRLEARSAGEWVVFRFMDMASWPQPAWFWRLLHRAGWRSAGPPVGERDWFQSPPDRYFSFYSEPPLVVFMPVDERDDYDRSTFMQIFHIMAGGGFHTNDLG